jgi:hypothetical protein
MGQGRENARAFLTNNPDIAVKLKTAIMEKVGLPTNGHKEMEEEEGKKEK